MERCKKTLEHKKEDITVVELGNYLQIKVSIRVHECVRDDDFGLSSINVVEGNENKGSTSDKRFN